MEKHTFPPWPSIVDEHWWTNWWLSLEDVDSKALKNSTVWIPKFRMFIPAIASSQHLTTEPGCPSASCSWLVHHPRPDRGWLTPLEFSIGYDKHHLFKTCSTRGPLRIVDSPPFVISGTSSCSLHGIWKHPSQGSQVRKAATAPKQKNCPCCRWQYDVHWFPLAIHPCMLVMSDTCACACVRGTLWKNRQQDGTIKKERLSWLSIHPCIHPSIDLPIHLSVHVFMYVYNVSIYIYTYEYVYIYIC